MKFLRSLLEQGQGQTIDVTQNPKRDAVSDAWPDGVVYKGVNIFKTVYDSDLSDRFQAMLKKAAEGEGIVGFDAQESFLAYIPSRDTFVMGFDTWGEPTSDNEDEHGNAANVPHVVAFKMDEQGQVLNAKVWAHVPGRMVYNHRAGAYGYLHKQFPDIVDIRLD